MLSKFISNQTLKNTDSINPRKNPETLPHKDNIPGLYSSKQTKKFIKQTTFPIQSQTNKQAAVQPQQSF